MRGCGHGKLASGSHSLTKYQPGYALFDQIAVTDENELIVSSIMHRMSNWDMKTVRQQRPPAASSLSFRFQFQQGLGHRPFESRVLTFLMPSDPLVLFVCLYIFLPALIRLMQFEAEQQK